MNLERLQAIQREVDFGHYHEFKEAYNFVGELRRAIAGLPFDLERGMLLIWVGTNKVPKYTLAGYLGHRAGISDIELASMQFELTMPPGPENDQTNTLSLFQKVAETFGIDADGLYEMMDERPTHLRGVQLLQTALMEYQEVIDSHINSKALAAQRTELDNQLYSQFERIDTSNVDPD